jgi:hypothetical protein
MDAQVLVLENLDMDAQVQSTLSLCVSKYAETELFQSLGFQLVMMQTPLRQTSTMDVSIVKPSQVGIALEIPSVYAPLSVEMGSSSNSMKTVMMGTSSLEMVVTLYAGLRETTLAGTLMLLSPLADSNALME